MRLGQILWRYGIGDARHCVGEMQSYSDAYEADNDEKEEATWCVAIQEPDVTLIVAPLFRFARDE